MEKQALTDRQHEIWSFIKDQIEAGLPPTRREIAEHFGVRINSVTNTLQILERKGWIHRDAHIARGLFLL